MGQKLLDRAKETVLPDQQNGTNSHSKEQKKTKRKQTGQGRSAQQVESEEALRRLKEAGIRKRQLEGVNKQIREL
jgi:hypothetical protein